MSHITVTLLTNRRTRQTVDDLDTVVAAKENGFAVVEGESNATEITVNYPDAYAAGTCYVYMKNSRGEYITHDFETIDNAKTFVLPPEMTFCGNTVLVFYADVDNAVTVWLPVIIPISETGVDYRKVATADANILRETIAKANQALESCQDIEERAINGEFGGKMVCSEDILSGSQTVNADPGTDISLEAQTTAQSVSLIIPSDIDHGYHAKIHINFDDATTTIEIVNDSEFPLMEILNGESIADYIPDVTKISHIDFYCDGFFVYCHIEQT